MSQGGVMPTGMQNQTASLKPPTPPTPGMGNQMGGFGGQAMSGTPGGFGMPSGGVGGFGGTAGKPSAPGGQTMPMQGGQLGQNFPTQQGQFLQNIAQGTAQSAFGGNQMQQQAIQGIQPMQNLGGMFGAMSPSTGTSQSAFGGNQMLQPMQQAALQNNLTQRNQPYQNFGVIPSAGLASLTPQQPQMSGLQHYGPQGRGHQ